MRGANIMRSEREMLDLILSVAEANERIRAVYINGSRANPLAKRDIYQDYDVVYVVTETQWFIKHMDWQSAFGEALMIQEPDKNVMAFGQDLDASISYGWLMLFKDHNRIDLMIEPKEAAIANVRQDSLTKILLDKDNCLPALAPPSDTDYHIVRPTEGQFAASCNNFWWCLQNVAKGIARDQLPYAMMMFHIVVRDELHKMLDWYIGFETEFSVSTGMWGKYYAMYLPEDVYTDYVKTYSDGEYAHLWDAVFSACRLFSLIARQVASDMACAYALDDEEGIMYYLNQVQNESAGK